jgi:hypothetical protein
MPYPYAEARALYERGRLESRRGIAVNECLQAALAIFVRLGAMKDMEDVERLAREIESTLPS